MDTKFYVVELSGPEGESCTVIELTEKEKQSLDKIVKEFQNPLFREPYCPSIFVLPIGFDTFEEAKKYITPDAIYEWMIKNADKENLKKYV